MRDEKKYQTIIVLMSALLLASLWLNIRWPIPVALALGLLAVLAPAAALLIHKGWMQLAMLMGKISNVLLLSVIFFLIVTPVGIIRRMRTGRKQTPSTSFRERSHLFTKQDLEKSW